MWRGDLIRSLGSSLILVLSGAAARRWNLIPVWKGIRVGSEMIVTVGVDTHTDVHVAAVLDQAGRLLATEAFPATTRGYAQLAPGPSRSES